MSTANFISSPMPKKRPVVIAIDGPAAAGKGHLASSLAARCQLAHLDTGLLYRAVGLKAIQEGLSLADVGALGAAADTLQLEELAPPSPFLLSQLRSEAVGSAASKVSTFPRVRAAVGRLPALFAQNPPPGSKGVIMDGRDVGTVLFPDADLKLFVTASDEVRAQRRYLELTKAGKSTTQEKILQEMRERDARDLQREAAPLKPAADAVVIDTSSLDADAALQLALRLLFEKCPELMKPGS